MIYEKQIPNSRALLPTFPRNCPDGSQFCPDGVSFCLEYHPQSLLFTQQSHPKTPPSPTQDTPFPGLNLKVGKMKFSLGNWTPSGRHVWKVVNTFLEVSKKKLFMKLSVKLCFGFYPTRQEPRLDLIAPAQPQVSCLRILGDSKPWDREWLCLWLRPAAAGRTAHEQTNDYWTWEAANSIEPGA